MKMLTSQTGAIQQNGDLLASKVAKHNNEMDNKITAGFTSLEKSLAEKEEQYERLLTQLLDPSASSTDTSPEEHAMKLSKQIQMIENQHAKDLSTQNKNMEE